jgi:hypothetical protein
LPILFSSQYNYYLVSHRFFLIVAFVAFVAFRLADSAFGRGWSLQTWFMRWLSGPFTFSLQNNEKHPSSSLY